MSERPKKRIDSQRLRCGWIAWWWGAPKRMAWWGGYSTAVWATNFLYIYRATASECVTQNSNCSMLGIIWIYVLPFTTSNHTESLGQKSAARLLNLSGTSLELEWLQGLWLSKIYPMIRLIVLHAVEICPFRTQHESVFLGKMFLGNLSEQRFPSEK